MNWPQTEVRTSFWKSTWGKSLLAVLFFAVGAVTWLGAQGVPGGRISDVAATPAYIVVNTPTAVTFTAVISDTNLRKHDPLKVLLVRTDASGNPIDIVGRMRDNGRRGDAARRDRTYTIQSTLSEAVAGPIYFKVAARFSDFARPDRDNDDWDKELGRLNDEKQRGRRATELSPLLRKLQRYELSSSVTLDARQPRLSWSQDSLEMVLIPSEPSFRELSITSNVSLSEVTLDIDPQLKGFLVVDPASIPVLSDSQPQVVRFLFSTSGTVESGRYQGTVAPRSASATGAPLKVSVEVWQSLPTTSGISLSIPPGWTADSSLDSTQLSSPELNALQNTATAEVPPYEIDIRSLPNPGRATLNEVASSFEDSWFETYASKTFETVNGHAAIRYSDVGAPVPHKTIIGLFVDAGDRVLLITALPVRGDAAAEAVLAQILATLRLQ